MRHRIYYSLILTLLSFSVSLAQQLGTIRGTIKDAASKEDLVGATVLVDGLNKGASADINGFFSLKGIPVGTYKLKVSFVGYKTKVVENVRVVAESVTEVNIFVEENTGTTLNEVRVVGQRLTNTEVSVISEIKAAQQIVSGISAAQIGKTLDRNAAEVVKRVPGVTIFGDRYINIRGLNERYNTVMLNNTFTPSMETDSRSFSFDIIPSSQIDRILIFKSPAAELPGEFAGGVVKIFTKSIPDRNYLTVDLSGAFRNGTTGKDFLQPQSDNAQWTSFNDGYSSLPSTFPTTTELKRASGATLTTAGRSLKNSWLPTSSSALPDMRLTVTGAIKVLNNDNLKIANISAVNYSKTSSIFSMSRGDYGYSQTSTGELKSIATTEFSDMQYNGSSRFGALHNWSFKVFDNHTFEIKNLFNQSYNAQYIDRIGFENGANWNVRSLDQIYRGIYTGQVVGRHNFNDEATKIDWVVGYNKSFREQPDFKRYRYNLADNQLLVPFGAAQTFNLGRTNMILDENAITAGANLVQRVIVKKAASSENNKELELKAGVYYEDRKREFDARNLGFVQASGAFSIGNLPIEQIFAPSNINTTTGVKIDEQTNASDSYQASNNQFAGYVSGNYSFTKKLNLIAGVRAEQNKQKLDSYSNSTSSVVNYNRSLLNILPSANLTYNFSEKSLLRAAYGKTVNRPEFREIAPFEFYDFVNSRVIFGNPQLNNADVDNFDLRYELYPTPSEVVTLALFYKKFTNPIEVVFDAASSGNAQITFANASSAYSTGAELELRKSLDKMTSSEFLNKINLVFNGAFIYSRVDLGDKAEGQSNNRPLQGQSPYIMNAGINYNDTKKNTQVSLLYNVIGKRIYSVGYNLAGVAYPDWYEMPRHVIDLTFSKEVHKNILIKGGVTDILNSSNRVVQILDGGAEQLIQSYKPGSVYSLGLVYTLNK
jgi:TonB-dependent receptor